MKHHKPGWSLGTILILLLTVVVTAGCLFLLSRIRGDETDVHMDAQRVAGLMSSALQGPTAAPSALQGQVRTVKVTLAPVTTAPAAPTPEPTEQPQETPPPAVQPPYSFSLTAGGLVSFHSDISDSVYSKADKTADYRPVLAPVSGKIYADMNLITLPQLLNTADRKYGDAMALSEAADALRALGVDEVILGSEHILDQGIQGAADTVSALTARGLACVGVNAGGAAQHRLVALNGSAVAVLSYTEALTAKSKNALKENGGALTPFSLEAARQDIRWARGQGARCVIVCIYWGKEDATAVASAQRKTAQALAEMGADVILGSRPTRVLPMEIISCTGEDGKTREAFVAYSLGTLLTENRQDGYAISGALLHLTVTCDSQGTVRFQNAEYTPTYIWREKMGKTYQYRVVCSADPAPEEMSGQQRGYMQNALNRVQSTLKNSPVYQRP